MNKKSQTKTSISTSTSPSNLKIEPKYPYFLASRLKFKAEKSHHLIDNEKNFPTNTKTAITLVQNNDDPYQINEITTESKKIQFLIENQSNSHLLSVKGDLKSLQSKKPKELSLIEDYFPGKKSQQKMPGSDRITAGRTSTSPQANLQKIFNSPRSCKNSSS